MNKSVSEIEAEIKMMKHNFRVIMTVLVITLLVMTTSAIVVASAVMKTEHHKTAIKH